MDQDASHKVTCAIRQRYTKQRITGCPWRGREQDKFECEKAYDGKFDEDSKGWAFGGRHKHAEITLSIELATVAYLEVLFHHHTRHDEYIWKEFEIHVKHDGEWDRDLELTINADNVLRRCGSRLRFIRDKEGNPKKGSEYKIGFAKGLLHRVERIFFKVHDSYAKSGNAVLSEVFVYGTKSGQFASTTKDHEGRYLMATQVWFGLVS